MTRKLSFEEYCVRRGYRTPIGVPNLLWRWFFVSLTQPPFGGFWRVWNPFLGYPLLLLYRKLGGDAKYFVACLSTFAVCGFGHDVLRMIINTEHSLQLRRTTQFLLFGLLVALSSSLRVQRWMRKSPPAANVVINLVLIAATLKFGGLLWDALASRIYPS